MSEEDIIALRRTKIQRLRASGIDPYPARFHRTHSAHEAAALLDGVAEGPAGATEVSVAGRVTAMRQMGKSSFLDLRDGSGRIQVYIKRDVVGAEAFKLLREVDLGDFLGATGTPFRTRTGEPTIEASRYTFLAKALRPPPEKWHGLSDVEVRYRQRYLDLMANEHVRQTFAIRSRTIAAIRRFLDGRAYLEVETPLLQASAGGAAARPFITHHNTLDRDFFLRIALELHLKRLVVGGFDRVYEIGRIFRNEGISTRHNPEFTMLESYEAYADYNDLMVLVEQMVSQAAQEVLGTAQIRSGDATIDLAPPWRRMTLRDAIREHAGIDFEDYLDAESLREALAERNIPVDERLGRGKLIDELLSVCVQPNLLQPTFVTDYPVELSPLAKRKPDNPRLVERFEVFIAGLECGNAYSELNDPIDQRQRLLDQARLKAAGDDEAELADEDFIVALEHGMPPTAGLGIGIDRLVMVFTGQSSIREVILFPALRERGTS